MYINKNNNTLIRVAQEVTIDGVTYGHQIFNDINKLNELNIFKATIGEKPDATFFGYREIVDYEALTISYEPVPKDANIVLETIQNKATSMIDATIQGELDKYNKANGIAIASIHNAESYSRHTGYSHQAFCLAIWNWSVELWEFMRAWQSTLQGIPTLADVQAKIDEKPFI